MSLTEDGECEQKVLEQLGADFGTFGLRPGLDGLQVTFVHPHLNLFRHTVGTATERKGKHMKHVFMKCKTVSDSLEKQTKILFFTLEIENRLILGFGKRLHKKIPECSLCASQGYFYYPICLHYPTGFCLLCYPLASTQSLYAWKQQHLIDQSLPNKTTIDPWHIFIKRKTIKLHPFRKTHTGPRSFMFGHCVEELQQNTSTGSFASA